MGENTDKEKAMMMQMLGGEAVNMVKEADKTFDQARDSKAYAGLMSLDQIKAKRARIESGEEYEDEQAKKVRQKRADEAAAVREEKAREARMLAKKEKLAKEEEEKKQEKTDGGAGGEKKKKKEKKKVALSFDPDAEEAEES